MRGCFPYSRWALAAPSRTINAFAPACALALACALTFCPARAQQQVVAEEERVEAATILQFIPFIEWPPNALPSGNDTPILIGVLGASRVEEFLTAQARGRRLPDGRQIAVKRLAAPDEVEKCHLVYICSSENGRLSQIMSKLKNKPVVSVGHDERFMEKGGLINMFTDNNKMRFEINPDEAANSKIRFSAKLLRLGRIYSKR